VFERLSLMVAAEEIVAASFGVSAYCRQELAGRKILLLGNSGVEDEMRQAVRRPSPAASCATLA